MGHISFTLAIFQRMIGISLKVSVVHLKKQQKIINWLLDSNWMVARIVISSANV